MEHVRDGQYQKAKTALSIARMAYHAAGMSNMQKAIKELQTEIDEAETEEMIDLRMSVSGGGCQDTVRRKE